MINISNISYKSTDELKTAFLEDGYTVVKSVEFQSKRGLLAESITATNYESGQKKKVYYVEGSSYQMGYLIGLLDAATVEQMCKEYVYNFLPSVIKIEQDYTKFRSIWKLLWRFISTRTKAQREKFPEDVPQMYHEEMKGIIAGAAVSGYEIEFDSIWNLNVAFDLILANQYTGLGRSDLDKYLKKRLPWFSSKMLIPPIFCNNFSAFENATSSGDAHYFVRDFMLSAADVLQHTASMIIYNPTEEYQGQSSIPFISVAAPGFVGSITGMNAKKVGVGVNIVPAANCDRSRTGLNSLMMVRHCTQFSKSATDAVETIRNAVRTVPWLYHISDGKSDQSVVVESGRSEEHIDFLSYSTNLEDLLPTREFMASNGSQPAEKGGMMERWNDFKFHTDYLDFNPSLFKRFKKDYSRDLSDLSNKINDDFTDDNCPDVYYFPHPKNVQEDILVSTNMYLIPEMRLCMMNKYTVNKMRKPKGNKSAKTNFNDAQWRYDTISELIQKYYGEIDLETAKRIISFLNPDHDYPGYYIKNPKSSDGHTHSIQGVVSVCDLKNLKITSLMGYYSDQWISLSLQNYVL